MDSSEEPRSFQPSSARVDSLSGIEGLALKDCASSECSDYPHEELGHADPFVAI